MANKHKPYYIQTLAHVVSKVKSLTFEPLKRDRANFQKARGLVSIPLLLKWLGYPITREINPDKLNAPCMFCPPGAHTTDTSLSVYRNRNKGCSWYYVESCGNQGDVSDLWEWIVQFCYGVPYPEWDRWTAAADLVQRAERGEFKSCNTLLLRPEGSGKKEGRPRGLVHRRTDIITANFGVLHQLKKRVKVKTPGGVRLPRPVSLTQRQVLLGYFPEEGGYVWIGEKFNWGHTKRRDIWLEELTTNGGQIYQYFVPNYMKHMHIRNRAGIRERRWIVVEADRYSLEQQYWIHLRLSEWLPLGCLCWSDGKSLHGSYYCGGLFEDTLLDFYEEAVRLGVNDISAYKPEQPVRFPSGWNREKGKQQLVYVWNM